MRIEDSEEKTHLNSLGFLFFLVNVIQMQILRAKEKPNHIPWVLS